MVEALKIPAHQPTSVGSMLPAPTATKIWLNTRNLDGELVLMGSAPVPIQLALIRTRTVKNAVAYWQVTVPPRLAGLRTRFEACANLVAVWWQIGDAVGW